MKTTTLVAALFMVATAHSAPQGMTVELAAALAAKNEAAIRKLIAKYPILNNPGYQVAIMKTFPTFFNVEPAAPRTSSGKNNAVTREMKK